MCIHSGGGGGSSAPPRQDYTTSAGGQVQGEPGIPQQYVDRGATTVAQYQLMAQQDESDKQLAQQKELAAQQQAFNEKQLQDQRDQQAAIQKQADEQAARQSTYDAGRADLLAKGTQSISDAFSKFSPDYFSQYTSDYLTKATDDINYQKGLAQKQLLFGLARQGIGSSQAGVDQQGLLEEKSGQATAQQTQNALDATDQLKTQVAGGKNNLLAQLQGAENVAPPIAGANDQSVQSALDTSRNAISGVTNSAGDTIANLGGVPTVAPLANIFSGVLGGVGSYAGGANANTLASSYLFGRNAALGGTKPAGSSGSTSFG